MLIVLDNLRSAHNVGSILRTAEGLGIRDIYLCGITPGPDDKNVQKTSLGAEHNLIIKELPDTYKCLEELKKEGYRILGLELTDAAVDIAQITAKSKSALVVGNEVSGLSGETLGICDNVIKIPMKGQKESLNVSVAFGIAAYELTKDIDNLHPAS